MSFLKKNTTWASDDEILSDPLFDDVETPKTNQATKVSNEIDISKLESFINENKRLPQKDSLDLEEINKYVELERIQKENPDAYAKLMEIIPCNLQQDKLTDGINDSLHVKDKKEIKNTSLDDIFDNDDLGLFDDVTSYDNLIVSSHILTKNQTKTISPSIDGHVTSLKQSSSFYKYQKIFDDLKYLLKKQDLGLTPFKAVRRSIDIGDILYYSGYFRLVVDSEDDKEYKLKSNNAFQRRVKIILDDGKEHTPFDASIATQCDKIPDSKRIIALTTEGGQFLSELTNDLCNIKLKKSVKRCTGFIYILKSKSTIPKLQELMECSNLVKIGYSTTPVSERIKNAIHEPTYLCSEVELVTTYKCYDFNPQKLEKAIHLVLSKTKLNVIVKDEKGRKYRPQEWFLIDVATAKEVIEKIIDNTIDNYRIDSVQGRLVKK